MADDEFQATGNWWDSSSRNVRFETGPSHSSSFPNNFTNWQQIDHHHHHHHDLKPSISDSPPMIMGLGLSSNPIDWNNHNHLLRAEEKGVVSDGRFKSTFQENNNNLSSSGGSSNFHQQVEWREKLLFSTDSSSTTTTDNNNNQYSTTSGDSIVTTSHGLASSFQHMDSSANPSLLQGLLLAPEASSSSSSFDNNNHHHNRSCFNFPYNNDQLMPSWPKVSQFLRASNSPPKQTQHHRGNSGGGNSQLQFTNNASFWNASEANHHHHHHAAIKEATRPSFFPNSLQPPFHHSPNFDAQSKNICGGRETSSGGKKSGGETAPKRARNETSSTLPPFKARKEKMGDRITALQQLVSPFGKTDTASVLSEAIEYIKFLHEQVSVLSTPYMKSGAPLQHQQSSGKCKEGGEALVNQDLRSRGLCLVPVASTFPVTHETTVDFWMPTFGATFR